MHRQSAMEMEIRTWKNHFVTGMGSLDKLFPLHLWDRMLHQAWIKLNLLRPPSRNPLISAYEAIQGKLNYERTPLLFPSTKVLVHENPQQKIMGSAWD